jgi:predicted MPP superfamily phosphohydrolase
MSSGRVAVFLGNVLAIWAGMHLYVFWRASSVPWIQDHCSRPSLAWIALGLWLSYPLARLVGVLRPPVIAGPFEFLASAWVGTLFLIFAALLALDVATLGGFFLPQTTPLIRGWFILGGLGLALIALIQGARPAKITEHEITLPSLPKALDGTILIVISDLHLGALTARQWTSALVNEVNAQRADLVLVAGDVIDSREEVVRPLLDDMRHLKARLGVWAVTGNHDYYASEAMSVRLMEAAGMKVLRDRAEQVAPGLWVAGVDDLTARPDRSQGSTIMRSVLAAARPGAVILVCHTPELMALASECGAGLMLSGHTHNGQIWPFNFLVRLKYPFITGRHSFGPMTLLIGNGTGTWGPRMRLWTPGQILRVTLRSAES